MSAAAPAAVEAAPEGAGAGAGPGQGDGGSPQTRVVWQVAIALQRVFAQLKAKTQARSVACSFAACALVLLPAL